MVVLPKCSALTIGRAIIRAVLLVLLVSLALAFVTSNGAVLGIALLGAIAAIAPVVVVDADTALVGPRCWIGTRGASVDATALVASRAASLRVVVDSASRVRESADRRRVT